MRFQFEFRFRRVFLERVEMAAEGALSFSVASVVEDVLHQHGIRSRDLDLESRRAEEAGNFIFIFILNFTILTVQTLKFYVVMTFLCFVEILFGSEIWILNFGLP